MSLLSDALLSEVGGGEYTTFCTGTLCITHCEYTTFYFEDGTSTTEQYCWDDCYDFNYPC